MELLNYRGYLWTSTPSAGNKLDGKRRRKRSRDPSGGGNGIFNLAAEEVANIPSRIHYFCELLIAR